MPVRPMPHCTSSKISCAQTSSQRARSAASNGCPRSTAPATPCTGSTITAAVSVPMRRAMAAGSAPRHEARRRTARAGSRTTSRARPRSRRLPRRCGRGSCLRWRRPCVRPVILSASFSAFSFASAPLLTKNTVSRPRSAKLVSFVGGALADGQRHARCSGTSASAPGARAPRAARMRVARAPRPRDRHRGRGCGGRRGVQPGARRRVDDLDRPLGEHLREVIVAAASAVEDRRCSSSVLRSSPAPAPSGPRSLRSPSMRFIHCTAPPAAPLVRLSIAHITAIVLPSAAAPRVRRNCWRRRP